MAIVIRSELVSDIDSIYELNKQVFPSAAEADLVNKLRDGGALMFSLLAVDQESCEILGHIAFSPVTILTELSGKALQWQALGLGPMAVRVDCQNQGIGSQLINFWLENYASDIYNALVVLGHAAYYPRFGFEKAEPLGFRWDGGASEENFMIRELKSGFLSKAQGIVSYHPAFYEL